MRFTFGILSLCLVLLGSSYLAPPVAAGLSLPPLLSHKAVYRFDLAKDHGRRSAIAGARGTLVVELQDACDGWTVSQRAHVVLLQSEGPEIEFGWSLSAWEAKDGLSYRFIVRQVSVDGEALRLRGFAELEAPGGAGRVDYSEPTTGGFDLPKGTLFPVAYSQAVLAEAAGETLPSWHLIFDGSAATPVFGVSAVSIATIPAGQRPGFSSPVLADQASWRLGFAYYQLDDPSGTPEQEQSMRVYANGVADDLRLDLGSVSLTAVLDQLELPASPLC